MPASPIACICNDLHARALRGLRPLCEIVSLKGPALRPALERLKKMLKDHKCAAEANVLETLMDKVNGDLRAAINTLQMITR